MKRNFDAWLDTFIRVISNYTYFTDFDKIYNNVEKLKIELNILNSLIGSKQIEEDFDHIVREYPTTLKCIPLLLAVRSLEIELLDGGESVSLSFSNCSPNVDEYKNFMRETGLFDLFENHLINSVVDYVTGVEVGLDSNARKNRGGHLMENIVEEYIKGAGFILDETYFKEMTTKEIQNRWGIDISSFTNENTTIKRFDFVIKGNSKLHLIETNFYSAQGSKLNETARSYKYLAEKINKLEDLNFVWITDGHGWKTTKKNLRETFEELEDLYNINDLRNGILEKIIV